VLPALACEELLISATCTDAGYPPDVYLNGTKLNTTAIDVSSSPGNEVRYFDLTPFADLLRPGVNTIAVALHNVWATDYDDIAFDMDLKAVLSPALTEPHLDILPQNNPPGGLINNGPTAGAQINLNLSVPPNTIWRIESADALPGPWQLVDVITNTSTAPLSIIDTGQNGRLPPSSVSTRFYRLVPN
jgi:hypothetical protein